MDRARFRSRRWRARASPSSSRPGAGRRARGRSRRADGEEFDVRSAALLHPAPSDDAGGGGAGRGRRGHHRRGRGRGRERGRRRGRGRGRESTNDDRGENGERRRRAGTATERRDGENTSARPFLIAPPFGKVGAGGVGGARAGASWTAALASSLAKNGGFEKNPSVAARSCLGGAVRGRRGAGRRSDAPRVARGFGHSAKRHARRRILARRRRDPRASPDADARRRRKALEAVTDPERARRARRWPRREPPPRANGASASLEPGGPGGIRKETRQGRVRRMKRVCVRDSRRRAEIPAGTRNTTFGGWYGKRIGFSFTTLSSDASPFARAPAARRVFFFSRAYVVTRRVGARDSSLIRAEARGSQGGRARVWAARLSRSLSGERGRRANASRRRLALSSPLSSSLSGERRKRGTRVRLDV